MKPLCITDEVAELLASRDRKLAENFRNTFSARGAMNSDDEIRKLNRYFRAELSKCEVPTLDERESLIDDIAPAMWLRYFKDHVLPTLVRFKLPSE